MLLLLFATFCVAGSALAAGNKIDSVTVTPIGSASAQVGDSIAYNVVVTRGTSATNASLTANLSVSSSLPTGVSFAFSPTSVTFAKDETGTKSATLTLSSNAATTPAVSGQTVTVVATGGGDSPTGTNTFTFTVPTPTVSDASPHNVQQGQSVLMTLTGANFISGRTTVDFGVGSGITAGTINVTSSTSLTVQANIGAATPTGQHDVAVSNGGTAGSLHNAFVVGSSTATTTTTLLGTTSTTYPGTASYTATVAPVPTGGTVTFMEGSTALTGAIAVNTTTGAAGSGNLLLNAGTHNVTAVYSGTSGYGGSTSGVVATVIAKATQAISVSPNPISGRTYGDPVFQITVSGGGSGNPVTLSSSSNISLSPASVPASGGTVNVTILGAGAASITANQALSTNYSAAPQVTSNFNVAKATPTLTFTQPADRSFGSPSFQLLASSNSTGAITFAGSSSVASVTVSNGGLVTIPASNDVDATVTVTATVAADANYNALTSSVVTFKVKENVAPSSLAYNVSSGSAGLNSWYISGPVVVDLSATDAGSGVDHMSYRVDGGSWVDGPQVTINTDGDHTIEYKATDNNLNVSPVENFHIKLDHVAPTINASPAPDNTWYTTPTNVHFTASDATSGTTFTSDVLLTGVADITKTITVTATDLAGNSTTQGFSYRYDATAPQDIFVTGLIEGGFFNTATLKGVTMTEPYPGSKQVWVSPATPINQDFPAFNAGTFTLVPGFDFVVSTPGRYTAHVVATDLAGNTATQDVHFTIDQDAPVIDVTIGGGVSLENGGKYNLSSLPIAWSLSDLTDPNPHWTFQELLGDIFSQDLNAFVATYLGTDNKSPLVPLSQEGRYHLTVKGKDTAGNESVTGNNLQFWLDYTKPESSAPGVSSLFPSHGGWYQGAASVILSAHDKDMPRAEGLSLIVGTGVKKIEFSLNGGASYVDYLGAIPVTAEGTTNLKFRAVDNAGNVEDDQDLAVLIDSVPPAFTADVHDIHAGRADSRLGKSLSFNTATWATDLTSLVESISLSSGDQPHVFPITSTGTEVTVTAVDFAGNQATTTFKVFVDKMLQQITLQGPVTAPTYGDAPVSLTATTDADGLTVSLEVLTGPGEIVDGKLQINGAGDIVVRATQAGDEAYEAAAPVCVTVHVNRLATVVKADNAAKTYGDSNPVVTAQPSVLAKPADSSEVMANVVTGVSGSGHVADVNNTTASGPATTANYSITYETGVLTINPASLTVTTQPSTKVYGDPNPAFAVSYDSFVNGDGPSSLGGTLTFSGATTGSPVGPHAITPAGLTSSDYDLHFEAGTLCITKASLSVTADDAHRLYGEANHEFTGSIDGIKNGDAITATYSVAGNVDQTTSVGDYPITPALEGAALSNYTVESHAGTLTIQQAPLTVTVGNQSVPYGAAIPNPLTGSISGIVNNDNITATYSTSAIAGSNAGNYAIVATLVDPDGKLGNYDVTNPGGTLSITQIALTIKADDKSMVLHGTVPALTATFTGFVNGDSEASLSTPVVLSTTATSSSDVGSYPITASGATSTNYTITFQPGTLKVKYATSGVLAPINQDGTSVFKKNSTIPVKIKIVDAAGVPVSAAGTILGLARQTSIAGTFGSVNEDVISTTPDTNFRWDATGQQWIFNLSTSNLTAGTTYVYRIMLKGGEYVEFRFGLK